MYAAWRWRVLSEWRTKRITEKTERGTMMEAQMTSASKRTAQTLMVPECGERERQVGVLKGGYTGKTGRREAEVR